MRIDPKDKSTWPDLTDPFYVWAKIEGVWTKLNLWITADDDDNDEWKIISQFIDDAYLFDITQCDEIYFCDENGWVCDDYPSQDGFYIIWYESNHLDWGVFFFDTEYGWDTEPMLKTIAWQPGPNKPTNKG